MTWHDLRHCITSLNDAWKKSAGGDWRGFGSSTWPLVAKELERFKKLLRWQWMGLLPSFSNPGVARRLPSFGSLRILFAKVSRPQGLKLEGEACEQVSVGSTTYYGRGDCSTLKQGSLRLCFDNECQECQDFLVRRERKCGDVLRLPGLLHAEGACAHVPEGLQISWPKTSQASRLHDLRCLVRIAWSYLSRSKAVSLSDMGIGTMVRCSSAWGSPQFSTA